MNSMISLPVFLSVSLVTVPMIAGCGAEDPSSPPDAAELDALRGELGDEIAQVEQALGEATCASAPADDVFADPSDVVAGSIDNNYGHPECTNGFIVDVPYATAGMTLRGGMGITRWPDPFTCLLNWGYLSLWQKQGASYVKLQEASVLGSWWFNAPKIGTACQAIAAVTVPTDGEYRLVAASGVLFGPTQRVSVYR